MEPRVFLTSSAANARRLARNIMSGVRLLGLVILLSALAPLATTARAGDSTVELPIPKEVEEGLETFGIKVETTRNWLEEPALWIAAAIVVAGVTIAYSLRRRKT